MKHLEQHQRRLTHPDLDFWVDVTVHERNGRFMATADLAEDRGTSASATRPRRR